MNKKDIRNGLSFDWRLKERNKEKDWTAARVRLKIKFMLE